MSDAIKAILQDEQKFNEVARKAFDSVDIDGSGQIESSEIAGLLVQISEDRGANPPSPSDVAALLKDLDTDKSGAVSFDEFKVLIREVLEARVEEQE